MPRLCLIFLLLTACSASSNKHVWQQVGATADGATLFLDRSSVANTGGRVDVWTKDVEPYPQADEAIYSLAHRSIDCSNRKMTLQSGVRYDSKGAVVSSYDLPPGQQPVADVVPDSEGEIYFKRVCNT